MRLNIFPLNPGGARISSPLRATNRWQLSAPCIALFQKKYAHSQLSTEKPLKINCILLWWRDLLFSIFFLLFIFASFWGGGSQPLLRQSMKTQYIHNNSFLQTGRRDLDLKTTRKKSTDARQEGREKKKEKERTKGVQCSRRKTLKLFYLDRKVDVPPASLFLDWFWFVAFISIIVSHGWLGSICLLWLIIVIILGRFI